MGRMTAHDVAGPAWSFSDQKVYHPGLGGFRPLKSSTDWEDGPLSYTTPGTRTP